MAQLHVRLDEGAIEKVKEAAKMDTRSVANWCAMVLEREATKMVAKKFGKGEAPKKGDDDAGFE